MKNMMYFFPTVVIFFLSLSASAKIWRVNNNAGVVADFTTFNGAATSTSVLAGDTIHLEPSATSYATSSFNLTKRLVVIGVGYFLNPANTTTPGNSGLQATTNSSQLQFFRFRSGSNGSRFIGVTFEGGFYLNASASAYNLSFEKCLFAAGSFTIYFENAGNYDGITIRKSFFNSSSINSVSTSAVITNFICENNIFNGTSQIDLPSLSGTGNIIRNNSIISSSSTFILANAYVANNIFGTSGQSTFTNCVIKNNLFQVNQTLPVTATGNQVNVNMGNVYVGGTTGSLDSRAALRSGSPAIAAGLTVGAVITPDCGAFGATDPYKLSGIPNIPSIYTFNVPTSIPAGTTNMNVTISTRNNN
jgi:hypothetical protein